MACRHMEMWSMQTETSGNKVVVLARKKKREQCWEGRVLS